MPFIDAAIRQRLGIVESCPSQEVLDAHAAAQDLQFIDGQLLPIAKPAAKKTKPAPTK